MCVSPGIVLATLTHWAAPSQLAARRTAAMRCDTSSCDDGLCRMVTWPRAGAPPATGAATGAVATPALDKLSTLCVCMRPGASSQLLTRADRQLRPETHFCSRALILFPSSGSSNHRPLTCRGVTTRACQSGYHNPAPGGRGRASLPERYSRYGGDISHSKLSNTSCTRFSGDSNDRGGASVSLHNRRDRTAAVPHPVPASWRVPVLRRLRMMNWKRGWVLLHTLRGGITVSHHASAPVSVAATCSLEPDAPLHHKQGALYLPATLRAEGRQAVSGVRCRTAQCAALPPAVCCAA